MGDLRGVLEVCGGVLGVRREGWFTRINRIILAVLLTASVL